MSYPPLCGCPSSCLNPRFSSVASGSCQLRLHHWHGISRSINQGRHRSLVPSVSGRGCPRKHACSASTGSAAAIREEEAAPLSSSASVLGGSSPNTDSDEEDRPDLPEPPILDTRVSAAHERPCRAYIAHLPSIMNCTRLGLTRLESGSVRQTKGEMSQDRAASSS